MALYYVGLDYHLTTSTAVILDARGNKVGERTVRGHWSKMVDWLKRQKLAMVICFEASCGYGAVHEKLATFARRLVVAHPANLRLIFRSKRKNDRVDAAKLAMLVLMDQVPAVHVPQLDVRCWRRLIEFRRSKIDQRVRIKNQIRALLRSHGILVPRTPGLWSQKGLAWLKELAWPSAMASMECQILLDELSQAQANIDKVTRQLNQIAAANPAVQLLMTIPGVGPRTAEAVAAYVDDAQRFGRIKRVGAYFGLVPCQDASAGVNRLGHITKQGPATARKLLVEAAWRCIDRCPPMRAVFDRIVAGKTERRRIALVAIAHKLTRIMLAMLRSGEVWDASRHAVEDQQDQRDPQQQKMNKEAAGAAA